MLYKERSFNTEASSAISMQHCWKRTVSTCSLCTF